MGRKRPPPSKGDQGNVEVDRQRNKKEKTKKQNEEGTSVPVRTKPQKKRRKDVPIQTGASMDDTENDAGEKATRPPSEDDQSNVEVGRRRSKKGKERGEASMDDTENDAGEKEKSRGSKRTGKPQARIRKSRINPEVASDDLDSEQPEQTTSIYVCAPHIFVDSILKKITKDAHKKLTHKIHFHRLLRMKRVVLPKQLIKLLIECFNEETCLFDIGDEHLDLKDFAQKVLGVPNGGTPIVYDFTVLRKGRCPKEYDTPLRTYFTNLVSKTGSKYHTQLLKDLGPKSDLDETTYCILFMLQAMCVYLAPKHNREVNRDFLHFLESLPLGDWKKLNWCDFFVDVLIHGIKSYKASKVKNRKCHGVVHMLAVIFFDFVTEDSEIPQGFPRINHVTDDDIQKLASKNFKELLQKVKKFDQTVYANDYTMETMEEIEENLPEMSVPEDTDLNSGSMADASINNPSPSIGQDLDRKLSELERGLSALPADVTKLIESLKDQVSSESGKTIITTLEVLLNGKRESVKDEVKQSRKMLGEYSQHVQKVMQEAVQEAWKAINSHGNAQKLQKGTAQR